ncbi:MAG: TIGR00730 family Rossman fold protein [Chloroflexota bacterium]
MKELSSICVFCGSSSGHNPLYGEMAEAMGTRIAKQNLTLVYGGGSVGLMGILAKAAEANGASVLSVIPESLLPKELVGESTGELIVCETMLERKAIMAQKSDAFIAMPGGYGTLDEIFEMVTWTQLGVHSKPMGLLNVAGFFDPLLQTLDHMVTEGFIKPTHRQLIVHDPDPAALLKKIDIQSLPKSVLQWSN